MINLIRAAILSLVAVSFLPTTSLAGPLTQARVTKIFNQVQVVDPSAGAHPASINELIKDEIGLKTGVQSRSELVFDDQTLTRIGPETYFTFKSGTRDMTLKQGTMLLQVPKGLGGAKIRTAAITASITGTTIMIEHTPGKALKVLVLEGSLRLSVNGAFGDSLVLTPGRMVIMRPDAKKIPDPVSVDLAKVVRTSSLVKMDQKKGAPLPSIDLINKEIAVQEHEKVQSNLIATNLVIEGRGTNVTFASDEVLRTISERQRATSDPILLASTTNQNGQPAAPTPTPVVSETPHPGSSPTPTPGASPTPGTSPTPTPAPGTSPSPTPAGAPIFLSSAHDLSIFNSLTASLVNLMAGEDIKAFAPIAAGSLIFYAGEDANFFGTIIAATVNGTAEKDMYFFHPIDADSIVLNVGHHLKAHGQLVAPARPGSLLFAPGAGRRLTLNIESLKVDSHDLRGISLTGGDADHQSNFEGGNGGILNVGSAALPTLKSIDISAPVNASTGANGDGVAFGGTGGTVNLVSKDTISIKSSIKVSESAGRRASNSGGNISIDSQRKSGTAISVTSSGELLSLLNNAAPGAGGVIKFTSAGGAINVNGGKVQADRGTVDIRNNGSSGIVTLTNATIHGNVVKVGALGSNGTLNVGGGTISADSTIKLFAGGSNGTVNFTNNVTLSGDSVKTIAGDTVKIFNGKVVTVNGNAPASVFTNHPNYTGFGGNGSTTGTFAGQGATTQPLSALPPGF